MEAVKKNGSIIQIANIEFGGGPNEALLIVKQLYGAVRKLCGATHKHFRRTASFQFMSNSNLS